jgi:TonB family protein
VTEDELRKLLVGKELFLRGGYMESNLSFNELGLLIGHSPQASYTLNQIQIDRVRLTKHKVELEGRRFGLHFLGALAYEDPSKAVETVPITPKKKEIRITIDREQVVVRREKKESPGKGKEQKRKTAAAAPTTPAATTAAQPAAGQQVPAPSAQQVPAPATQAQATPQAGPESASGAAEPSEAEQLKAGIAAAPEAEPPADPASVTTTFSPQHASNLLRKAIGKIFAIGIDDELLASMPDFWRLYYQAVADKADYRPKDPAVLRQNNVDKKAKLQTAFQPQSNEYAQADSIYGMAVYHTVVGPDGKAQEIAVARPIGFGLDENAVESIRKASFDPAIKDGKPVPVLLDLVVQFHIYSQRTAQASKPEDQNKPPEPSLPGPYSVQHQ